MQRASIRVRVLALLLLTALPLVPASLQATAGPWQENERSRVRLVSPWETAPRDGDLRLGLEFEIIPGWHVYWKNSGDAGFPPAIQVLNDASSPGLQALELLYPAPERYELRGGLVAFGYGDHVIYPLRLTRSGGSEGPEGAERLFLSAALDYLVCEVDCIPYSYELTLEQPLAAPGEQPVAGSQTEAIEGWWERLPVSLDRGSPRPPELSGVTTRGRLDLQNPESPILRVELEGLASLEDAETEPQIFLEAHDTFDTGPPEWQPTGNGLRFAVPLTFREVPDALPAEAHFAWTVTHVRPIGAEDEGSPTLAVEARRTVLAAPSATSEPPSSAQPPPAPASSWPRALLAGLILALTPALLALLGLRWLALGRLAAPGIRRGAVSTVLGLLVGFGIAAFVFSDLPTWGAQLQDPLLVAALVLTTLGLAFATWGLLPFTRGHRADAPRDTTPGRPEIPGFLAGFLAAFLALSWNVPGLSFEPLPVLMAGLGASVPYLLTFLSPQLAWGFRKLGRRLRLREALGFLALVGLLWLLYLLTSSITPEGLALVQLLLLALGLLAWARKVAPQAWLRWLVTLLLLATAAYVFVLVDESRVVRVGPLVEASIDPGHVASLVQ